MATLVGEGTHSLHDTGATAPVSVVSDEALARLVEEGDRNLWLERASEEHVAILHELASELIREEVGSFSAVNSRVIITSSRDGRTQSIKETMRVDVSDGPELIDAPYVRGDIEIDDHHRPLSETLTESLGARALKRRTQVEYLYPEWFLG